MCHKKKDVSQKKSCVKNCLHNFFCDTQKNCVRLSHIVYRISYIVYCTQMCDLNTSVKIHNSLLLQGIYGGSLLAKRVETLALALTKIGEDYQYGGVFNWRQVHPWDTESTEIPPNGPFRGNLLGFVRWLVVFDLCVVRPLGGLIRTFPLMFQSRDISGTIVIADRPMFAQITVTIYKLDNAVPHVSKCTVDSEIIHHCLSVLGDRMVTGCIPYVSQETSGPCESCLPHLRILPDIPLDKWDIYRAPLNAIISGVNLS
jgi:hypothetical protein